MTDEHVIAILERVEREVNTVFILTSGEVTSVRESVKGSALRLKEETSAGLASAEAKLISHGALVARDASFHLLRAYYHASPSLIALILAIYAFVKTVVEIINIINTVFKVITGETLAYWLNMLIPGFKAAWDNMMNKISEFSAALGWGVDGVQHLLNIANAGAYTWGALTGKTATGLKSDLYLKMKSNMESFSTYLSSWQSNPGKMISDLITSSADSDLFIGSRFMTGLTEKLDTVVDKTETVAKGLGDMTGEFLAIQNDMPAIIAKNIPAAIWNSITYADTMINDRLLPRLDDLSGRIEELDAVLDAYRAKAEALADRLAHPGDLLAEIDKLPGYARTEQLGKIDSITSATLRAQNEAEFAVVAPDLRAFAAIAEALSHAPPAPGFMELELPGRSPGIMAEPRETWFVGDY